MEIKMFQCPNGHYYNAAMHSVCPECGQSASGAINPTIGVGTGGGIGATVGVDNGGNVSPVVEGYEPTIIGGDNFNSEMMAEPVVGWLVCVEGPMKGKDYRIHGGYNYIGREEGDIHIHGDNQISRQNHAMIAYDSGDHRYYFGPSGGRNLIKVNGKTILNAVEVNNYDILTIGTSKMMFVGLCGPHFDWNEGSKHD